VDVLLPEYRYLQPAPKFAALMKPWRRALALPEETATVLLEVAKFLATVALITATGVLLLMVG
jgi:hypothetical protein